MQLTPQLQKQFRVKTGQLVAPGRIVLEGFTTVEEAQQKILALIMALGNDPDGFADLVTVE